MQILDDEIRLNVTEAQAVLDGHTYVHIKFLDAVLGQIRDKLPSVLSETLTNFYVVIEVHGSYAEERL
jgi:hypothetical protein